METNISQLSTTELKALAYDQMVQFDVIQNNLRILNQELAKRSQVTNTPFIEPIAEGSIQKV